MKFDLSQLTEQELLPPTAKRKIYERVALKIREFVGSPLNLPLDPWKLAERMHLKVVDIDQISGLSPEARKVLLSDDSRAWSGATTMPLPNGWRLVFLNKNQSRERQAATLMEEVCHVILGHSPTQLMPSVGEGTRFRNFNQAQEEAAFAVGAATLIPYASLKFFLKQEIRTDQIARHFRVSRDLVIYRIKVCRLWQEYKHLAQSA